MGNRAILKAKGNDNKGVYLHWNGGRDSIEAFLKYCELRGFPGFEDSYGMARFVQVVSNFFGADGLSIGITDHVESAGDNGVYVIEGWKIVDRIDFNGVEQKKYDLQEMLLTIDEAQPTKQQLGKGYLQAEEIKTSKLKVGDKVYLMDFAGKIKQYEVMGIGEDGYRNGINVKGIPYVNRFGIEGTYHENINNYILDEFVKIVAENNFTVKS